MRVTKVDFFGCLGVYISHEVVAENDRSENIGQEKTASAENDKGGADDAEEEEEGNGEGKANAVSTFTHKQIFGDSGKKLLLDLLASKLF